MLKLDLSDAYHLVNIHKNYRKYLGFEFENKIYEYTCLPFGLSAAIKPILFI